MNHLSCSKKLILVAAALWAVTIPVAVNKAAQSQSAVLSHNPIQAGSALGRKTILCRASRQSYVQ